MANTKKKLLKQISSLALCLCMILSCLPISAFAESQDGTCEHHHEHTAECGYVAAVEGQPCTHECGEECAEGCVHEHDDTCGYVAAVEGSPCQYECEEDHGEEETTESTETSAPAYIAEEVKAMIDALPDVSEMESMDSDELNSVYEQAQKAYDAFETLTDEEQIELANDLVKLRNVLDFMTTQIQPLGTSANYKGFTIEYWSTDTRCQKIYNVSVEVNGSELTLKFDIDWKESSDAFSGKYTLTHTKNDYSCDKAFEEQESFRVGGYTPTFRFTKSTGHYVITWTSAGSTQHTGICEICGETVTENHTGNATCSVTAPCSKCGENYINSDNHKLLDNGICGCGKAYQEATLNNGVYEISNLGQLCWFSQQVCDGKIKAHSAILTADITIDNSVVWKPISLADHSSSTFDGDNHTITFANTREGSTFGLFGNYNYSTIKNLYLAGSIACNQSGDTSALVNRAYSTTIQNVISTCTVNNSGTGLTGGLTGYFGGGTATIQNSAVYADVTGGGYAGGLIGSIWNGNQTIQNVSNCAYIGSVTGGSKAGALVGYNGNNSGNKSLFKDVYYYEKNGLGYLGATKGGTITATCVESMTAEQFKSGEVAYKLNNGVTNGTQVWYQTCQSDSYPKFSGETVYMGYICGNGDPNPVYRNSMDGLISISSPEHIWEDGVCQNCGEIFGITPAVWNESKRAYAIYNASHLLWFTGLVNGTLEGTAQNQSANAILMADIDMSSVTNYVPIGGTTGLYYSTEGEDKGYQGIFDGNGHVLKNLSVAGSNTAQLTYGVFGTLSGTVKHLGVENFTFTLGSQDCRAGGIAGQMLSDGLIEDCYVANSTITATGKVAGGIAGCNYAGTIKNCFTYKVTVTASRTGGIVGDNCGDNNSDRKGSVINCYTDASAIESSSRKGNVSNSTAGISESDFTSGLVGYLLDGSRNLWKQTIGSQDYPTFNGATIKVDGYNIAGSVISAKITWTAMEFTYTYSAGTWNPDTHSYSGGSGVWSVVDGGGAITVENKGEQDFYSAFGFTSIISGITGEFDIKSQLLTSGASVTSKLTISGTPAESGFSNLPLGTAKVALSKNQPAAVWNVGDKVTYIGDDGKTYNCVVISKNNGICTLITDGSVEYFNGYTYSAEQILSKVQATGGRLPDFASSVEMDALRARVNSTVFGLYLEGTAVMGVNYKFGQYYYKSYLKRNTTNYNLYLIFDVPSL